MYYIFLQLHFFVYDKLPQLGVKSHLEMVNVYFVTDTFGPVLILMLSPL